MEGTISGNPSTTQTSSSSGNLLEIKIKTLDSQVYSCRVDKNITVPALKDQIATVTGVPAENQRLICRGRVLKDDHTLTEYNVEDGHTLHLVTRQVPQPGAAASSAGATAGEEERRVDDPATDATTHNRPTQISHSVVMGTFNVPDNGDGALPDMNRFIASVLQSLGLGNIAPNAGANMGGPAVNPSILAVAPATGGLDNGVGGARPTNVLNQQATSDRGAGQAIWPIAGLGMLPGFGQQARLLQQAVVTPDALTVINQYLDGLEWMFAQNGQHTPPSDIAFSRSAPTQPVGSSTVIRGYPTPANLGAAIQRTMNLINGQGVVEFNRLSSQLETEPTTADAGAREELQSAALRDGILLQRLGALLLELGRVTLTLRVGPSAMESAVNAGPAVFISPAGPNPMMVQPLPFQPGPGFGIPSAGPHYTAGAMGFPEIPRNVSIHIHANESSAIPGFRAPGQALAASTSATQVVGNIPPVGAGTGAPTPSESRGATSSVHSISVPVQISGPSVSNEQPGIRVVPMRAVVAAVPANLQSRSMADGSGVHPNILHPFFARFQQLSSQQGGHLPGGTVSSSSTGLLASSSAAQQIAAPVFRVPEVVAANGQGCSTTTATEAICMPFNASQALSSVIPQQDQQQHVTKESQAHLREDTTGVATNANDIRSNDPQQVSCDQSMGVILEVSRELQSQPDVVMNESNARDSASTLQSHETVDVEEKPNDENKTNVPAGLDPEGLQSPPSRTPKRSCPLQRTLQVAGSSEQGVQNPEIPANEQHGPGSTARTDANAQGPSIFAEFRNPPSQTSQRFTLLNSSSSRGAANGGASTTRSRDVDQGMGLSAGALGNIMGQVMQNPSMRSFVQQVVQQVGEGTFDQEGLTGQRESGTPQPGVDFSRVLQNTMPVVGQSLNRVASTFASDGSIARNGREASMRQGPSGFPDMQSNGSNVSNGPNISALFQQMMPAIEAFGAAFAGRAEQFSRMPDAHLRNADGRETATPQEQMVQREEVTNSHLGQPEAPSCEEPESEPVVKRQKIDVEKALEKLEQGSRPNDIVRVIAETASMLLSNQEPNIPLLAQFLCEDDGLAFDYMALLSSNLTSCREDNI